MSFDTASASNTPGNSFIKRASCVNGEMWMLERSLHKK